MNVHKVYDTINHYHLDWLTPAGDYPKSALMVVECKDGRWMIVQEFGEEYGCFEGVLKNYTVVLTGVQLSLLQTLILISVYGLFLQVWAYDTVLTPRSLMMLRLQR